MCGVKGFLWVGLGGAVGSMARHALTSCMTDPTRRGFPYGTLCVNLIGSFLLGMLAHLALTTGRMSPALHAGLTAGVLGGFTTYSAFNQETLTRIEQGAWSLAAINVAATLCGCLCAGLAGQALGRALVGA